MSLAQSFEGKFRADIRFRGSAYLQADRVAVTRVTPEQLYASVRDGGVEYQTQLSRLDGELRMFCTCVGDAQSREPACKHLWATILAVDAGNYLTAPPSGGRVPPFVAETESSISNIDLWDDELSDGDVYQPATRSSGSSSAGSTSRVATRPSPKLRDWESKLLEVRSRFASSSAEGSREAREREIFFEVDVDESRRSKSLVIQTSQRQRRASGQWGKLKPLKLRPGKLDDIEHEDDRRILAYLVGGTPERNSWYAQQAEFQTSIFRYRVPFELCELILPMMCGTGRVRLLGGVEKNVPPLTWDDGPAWVLTLAVRDDEGERRWKVTGELRRDDEVKPLVDIPLVIPGGLVVTDTAIARLEDFNAFDWVDVVGRESGLSVDYGEEHELVERLLDMPAIPRLDLPEELRLEEVQTEPSPFLVLQTPKSRGWRRERLQGNVEFDYLGTRVSAASVQWAIVQRDQNRCVLRDQEFETSSWSRLQELGFRRLLDHRQGGYDVDIAIDDLGRAVRTLVDEGWQVRADGKQVRQAAQLKFRINSQIDWFELSGDVQFGDQNVAFPELLAALSRGDTTIRLGDGSLGILPEEWLQQYGLLAGLGTVEEDHLRFSNTQAGLLDALLSAQPSVEVDEQFDILRTRLREFDGVAEAKEPAGFEGELRSYQREGLGWLQFLKEFRFGGCLADDMGLGKTVQLLALLLERKAERKKQMPSLVVVPKSLLFNWVQETRRFTPQLKCVEYTGTDRAELRDEFESTDLVLTTYGTLRRDIVHLKDVQFDYAVLDEAQTIKNASSQIAKASRLVQANYRIALSGTPIENHMGDLWSIFEFLNPGMLGRSSAFRMYSGNSADEASRAVLARGLRPFVLRRTKQQVAAELPEKFEETIFCRMGKRQQKLYDELRVHYRDTLLGMVESQGLGKSKMHVLEALLRLRQAACHPALLDRESSEDPFAKLEVLCPHLEELIEEGHKSLVFSQFTSMLSIVKEHLDRRGIRYAYLDGQTRRRKQVVDQFQNDPDTKVFLISLKAGGLGLNLTAAEYVFLLDPWWNPAVEAQAIDRAHRVGQTKQVFAYRLICRGTVEEKILDLQKKKRELADAILEADGSLIKDLTAEDLELLLS
ncbi:DEAD/DEAH box helicase [Maioricimonas sp. JC845]|uniref:DEAD/DEAH box helicase n=1 Tax=Maioricimonas sp. JC845 TaxID=3232138 RepID=UPI00345A8729